MRGVFTDFKIRDFGGGQMCDIFVLFKLLRHGLFKIMIIDDPAEAVVINFGVQELQQQRGRAIEDLNIVNRASFGDVIPNFRALENFA